MTEVRFQNRSKKLMDSAHAALDATVATLGKPGFQALLATIGSEGMYVSFARLPDPLEAAGGVAFYPVAYLVLKFFNTKGGRMSSKSAGEFAIIKRHEDK